jgi:dephospho-CoA kinase
MVSMPEDSRIVVGVAGRIGSGKTAIAKRIERECGFQYLRYSQVLAEWQHVDPMDKIQLQRIGQEVMDGGRQHELNGRLIDGIDSTRDAVIDGLRHPVDFECLQAEFGPRFSLIFVDTPFEDRFKRRRDRFGSLDEFREADSRSVESHIDSFRPVATLTLSGTMSDEELSKALDGAVRKFRKRIAI